VIAAPFISQPEPSSPLEPVDESTETVKPEINFEQPEQKVSEPTVIVAPIASQSESSWPLEPVKKSTETVKPEINFQQPKQEATEFKIRTNETLIEHLTIEEVTTMATDGRLKEYHWVARQSSENWIEAPKVPALRPIYDKRRNALQPEPPVSALEIPKRGLFRRLFGRN
jgi:hypothetical protein